MGHGPRSQAEPLRPADQRRHDAPAARRLPPRREDEWREHEPRRHLGGRHGDRQAAARPEDVVLRRRRDQRPAGRPREPRDVRLPPALRRGARRRERPVRRRHAQLRGVHRRRRAGDPRGQGPHGLHLARHGDGRGGRDEAFRLPRMERPVVPAALRPGVRGDEGLRHHGPPGLPPRPHGEVQDVGRTREVRPAGGLALRRPVDPGRDPRPPRREGLVEVAHRGPLGRDPRRVGAREGRDARSLLRPAPERRERRLLPRGGVQEARVRSEDRGADRAGDARREGDRDDPGPVPVRRAGGGGEGPLQGDAQRPLGQLVSPLVLGLVLRPRSMVVRLRLRVVPRLGRVGMPPPGLLVVDLVPARAARGGRRRDGRARARRDRQGRDRHGPREGRPRRRGPLLHHHRGGHRPLAADDRRAGAGARRQEAVQGLRVGRPRILPRGRHGARVVPGPAARREAGEGQGRPQAPRPQLRQGREALRGRGPEVGPRHDRAGDRGADDRGGAGGAVSPVVRRDRRREPRDRGRVRLHGRRRRVQPRGRLPIQRDRADPGQEGVRAGREGDPAGERRPRRRHRAPLRAPRERRLRGAAGHPPGGEEHDPGDRRHA